MLLHNLKRTKSFARVLALIIRSLSLLSTLACFNFSINSFPSLEATALGNDPLLRTASFDCAALYFSLRASAGIRKYLDVLSLSFSAVHCCVFSACSERSSLDANLVKWCIVIFVRCSLVIQRSETMNGRISGLTHGISSKLSYI